MATAEGGVWQSWKYETVLSFELCDAERDLRVKAAPTTLSLRRSGDAAITSWLGNTRHRLDWCLTARISAGHVGTADPSEKWGISI